ncbi:MAG: FliM/FliN family flagellar motor C-terminal domain-containing protein [Planctomycetota bacterium]
MPVLANQPEEDTSASDADVQRILKLRVPVIVRIAERKLPLSDVLRLAHGSILELQRSSDEPLHLMVNNQIVGEGEPVKVGEHFGLRVTSIGDIHQRVDALGG